MEALELPSVDVHCKTVMQNLHRLKCNEKLCDMALGAGGQKFFAHKCVVLAACPILESFIDETQTEFPYVVCNEVSSKGLSLWIDYIYTGIAPSSLDEQSEFIKVCDTFFMFGKPLSTDKSSPEKVPSTEVKKPGRKRGAKKAKAEPTKTSSTKEKRKSKANDDMVPLVDNDVDKFTLEDLIAETVQDVDLGYSDVEISDDEDVAAEEPVKPKRARKSKESIGKPTPKKTTAKKTAPKVAKIKKNTPKKEKFSKTGRKNLKIPKEAPFLCPREDCDFLGDDRPQLLKHYKKHQQKKFKCKECGSVFLIYDVLKAHELSHEGIILPAEAPFKCPATHCPVICENQVLLWRHYKQHGRMRFKCEYCEEKFNSNRELQFHHISHVGQQTFDCEVCSMKFFSESKLEAHNATHIKRVAEDQLSDPQTNDESANEDSGNQTSNSTGDKENIVVIATTGQFVCQIGDCGKEFGTKDKLAYHSRNHSEKKVQCTMCDQKFHHLRELKVHERTHTGERPFKCDVCGKSFTQKSILESHMSTHGPTKGEICAFCGLAYTYKKSLAHHIKMKHGKKPTYTCDICGKGYDLLAKFTQHKDTCVGNESLMCELCGKTLKSQLSYQCHTARCKGVEYRCQACKLNFKARDLFKQHMIEVHVPNQSIDCLPLEYRHLVQSQKKKGNKKTTEENSETSEGEK